MSRQRDARQKQAAKERRAENRKLAESERVRRRRNAQIKKVALRAGAVVAVVAVVVAAVVVVREVIRSGRIGPVNMASDGLLITGDGTIATAVTTDPIPADGSPTPNDISGRTSGILDIVVYVDYGDPASAQFWQASGATLTSAVTSGYLTLEIHPVALEARTAATPAPTTDAADSTDAAADPSAAESPADATATLGATDRDYARRAANTFACVAANVPDQALDVHSALLAAQPTLDAAGLTDAELVALVEDAGVDSADVRSCIGAHNFTDWVDEATDRAAQAAPSPSDWRGTVTATPTVVVAGQPYTGAMWDVEAFASFLDSVYQSHVPTSTDGTETVPGAAEETGSAPTP